MHRTGWYTGAKTLEDAKSSNHDIFITTRMMSMNHIWLADGGQLKIKPCSQNMRLVNRKFYIDRIGRFWQFHVNLNENKQRTYARMCSNWNLVMPFSLNRIYYMIPRYWVVGGARGGPLYLKKGTFFLMSLNQSIPVFNKKSPFTASEMTFYIFV